MSQTASNRRFSEVLGRMNQAFVANTGLSPDEVRAVYQAMQTSELSFVEATLHLGLMTQEQVDRAIAETLQSAAKERPAIIETALRKVSSERQLVVRRGSEVVPDERLAPALDPTSSRGEQLRALRTQLLLLNEKSRTACILAIVSPCSGDGRTRLAADLALCFAQLGKRTLLVDADMRRPQLQSLFRSKEEYGLADAIAHDSEPYLHPVKSLPHMQFLAAGMASKTNPLELLSDNRFAKIVENWRSNNTFVIIDTPPITEFSDALAVATLAGRVLVLSRAKRTTYASMRDTMRQLAITQARVLGAVLNHF